MLDGFSIRRAESKDYESLALVMYDSARNTVGQYSDVQRAAWVPCVRRGKAWQQRLDGQTLIMAEKGELVAGFIGFTESGYIDFAYVRPSFQGRGVFRELYQNVEECALLHKFQRLWAHVSLDARQAFECLGFKVTQRETVYLRDQALGRFEMEKSLSRHP